MFMSCLYVMIPTVLNPVLWTDPFDLPDISKFSMNDNYLYDTYNTKSSSTALRYLEGVALSPESTAVDESTGLIYASLGDGTVIALNENGEYHSRIFFTPEALGYKNSEELYGWCHDEAKSKRLSYKPLVEYKCGRPLGLRLKKIKQKLLLYILDAYHGLFIVDISDRSRKVEHIINPNTTIHVASSAFDPVAIRSPKFFNDLDVQADGTVYFTDSSYKHTRAENRQELLDAAPRGRVFYYRPNKHGGDGKLRVLLCGLHFPNGVQLSVSATKQLNEKYLYVVESARFRVLRVNIGTIMSLQRNHLLDSCAEQGSLSIELKKSNKGGSNKVGEAVSILLDAAPGFLDNIRVDTRKAQQVNSSTPYSSTLASQESGSYDDGMSATSTATATATPTYYFIGAGVKSAKPFSLLYTIYQTIELRKFIGKFIPMYLIEHFVPKYGMVLIIDDTGSIKKILQDPTGKVSLISEVQRHPNTGDLVVGSHSNQYIGIIKNGTFADY